MISYIRQGDLLKHIAKGFTGIDGIMNAANAVGPMGSGIAGAIRRAGGKAIQDDAFNVCKDLALSEGNAYITISGTLRSQGIKSVIHAVTMKNPGGVTNLDLVEKAFSSALDLAISEGITCIGCTALGTGVGRLSSKDVADTMFPIAKASSINVVFVDFHHMFISRLLELNHIWKDVEII